MTFEGGHHQKSVEFYLYLNVLHALSSVSHMEECNLWDLVLTSKNII